MIPRYDPNDVPLNDYARQVFTQVGQMLPTACGGGVYVYAGKEFDAGEVNGFAGGITEFDSREGVSKARCLREGPGKELWAAADTSLLPSKGQVSTSGLGYLGVGAHAGVAGGSAGGVAFANGAGVYADGSLFGRAAEVGAYANITTNGACDSGQR